MRVRKLDENADMVFGHGVKKDFWIDVPDAPAQCVRTRLGLWQREWFLDLTAGMTWNTQVLGYYTGSVRDPAIRARMLETQGIRGIADYSSANDRDNRTLIVSADLDTVYGPASFVGPV